MSDATHTHHYEYEPIRTGPDPSRDVEIIARCKHCPKVLDADEIMALVNEGEKLEAAKIHWWRRACGRYAFLVKLVGDMSYRKYQTSEEYAVALEERIGQYLADEDDRERELPQPPERE